MSKFQNDPSLMKRAKSAWRAMRRRCLEPTHPAWPIYGGVGTKVCPQWASFDQFLRDMGLPPTPHHWLGRRDTSGHYTRSNCLWTTHAEQQRRRRFCHRAHLKDGQILTAAEVARLPGMPGWEAIRNRLTRGFDLGLPQPRKLYRASMWVTWKGETLPTPEWARRLGVAPQTLWSRLNRGMPLQKAMQGPIRRHRKPTSSPSE